MADHETLSIVRHVGLRVDFSAIKSSLGLEAFTFVCEVNLDGLCPFGQWECNGHGPSVLCVKWPWLSSKGRTMDVGKAVLGSHRPSSTSVKWEWTMLWDHWIFWWRNKEGMLWFNIICLKLYQLERTTWWCLSVLEFVMEFVLQPILKFIMLEKILKNHGVPKFASGPPLGGRLDVNYGRPWNLIHSLPCRNPCRLSIHEVFFGPLGLHLRVWSELGRSPPFWPMRALRLQWSWAFNVVCEVALR